MKKTKTNIPRFMSPQQIILLSTFGFFGLYIFFLSIPFPFSSGPQYLQYPFYVIACGKQPVVVSDFMSRTYKLPDSETYDIGGGSRFFCTEQEAIDNGYSKSQ